MNEKTYSQLPDSLQQKIFDILGAKEVARIINPASWHSMRNGHKSIIQKFLDKKADKDVIRFLENFFVASLRIGGFTGLAKDLRSLPFGSEDIVGWLYKASLTQKNSKPTPMLLAMIITLQMQAATDKKKKHRLLSSLKLMALHPQGAPAVALCLDVINLLPGKCSVMQELNESKDIEVQANAFEALGLWGQAIKNDSKKLEIIKELIAKLGDRGKDVRDAAAQALVSIVPSLSRDEDKQEIIKELIAKLGVVNMGLREGAARVLGSIVPSLSGDEDKQKIIKELIDKLGYGWGVGKAAAQALGSIVPTLNSDENKQEIIKELIAKLGDLNPGLREGAARVLGSIVPSLRCDEDKQEIIKQLIAKLGDRRNYVRKAAAQALGSIVPNLSRDEDKQKSIAGLIAKLGDGDSNVCKAAVYALGRIVPTLSRDEDKQKSIAGLIAKLGHGDWWVRQAAVYALGRIVPTLSRDEDKQKIIKELIAKLDDGDKDVRKAAAQALGSIVPTLYDEQTKKTFLLELLKNKGFSWFKDDAFVEVVAMASQIKDKNFLKELLSKQPLAGNGSSLSDLFKQSEQAGIQATKPCQTSFFARRGSEHKNADLKQEEANTQSHIFSRCVIS